MTNHTPEQIRAAAQIVRDCPRPGYVNQLALQETSNYLEEWATNTHADESLAKVMFEAAFEGSEYEPNGIWRAAARAARTHIANEPPAQDDDGEWVGMSLPRRMNEGGRVIPDGKAVRIIWTPSTTPTEPPTGTKLRDRDGEVWEMQGNGSMILGLDVLTFEATNHHFGPLHQVWGRSEDVPNGVQVRDSDGELRVWVVHQTNRLSRPGPFTAVNPYGETK